MSLKGLLGLESFNLTDSEIMAKLKEARRNQLESVEFLSGSKKVSVRLVKLSEDGVIKRDY